MTRSVERLATGWAVRRSNASEGEVSGTRPKLPWGPPSLLYNGYGLSFPGVSSDRSVTTTQPHLAVMLKKEQSYTSTPPLDLHGRL
jgi:hypothetical protein